MDTNEIEKLLKNISTGKTSVEDALGKLKHLPFKDIDGARIDHHRTLRCGFPEVVFCERKETEQIVAIAKEIIGTGCTFLGTRASIENAIAVKAEFPSAVYNEKGRTITVFKKEHSINGLVAIVSAGTSDASVAEEAVSTAVALGANVKRLFDVGVAGIHRVLAETDLLQQANAIVVVAGMEGALPSVVAGLTDAPVIAVPTSVGYGASFGGIAALLGMLNSCASGVTVVNIDNGFGGGYAAASINRRITLGDKTDDR